MKTKKQLERDYKTLQTEFLIYLFITIVFSAIMLINYVKAYHEVLNGLTIEQQVEMRELLLAK